MMNTWLNERMKRLENDHKKSLLSFNLYLQITTLIHLPFYLTLYTFTQLNYLNGLSSSIFGTVCYQDMGYQDQNLTLTSQQYRAYPDIHVHLTFFVYMVLTNFPLYLSSNKCFVLLNSATVHLIFKNFFLYLKFSLWLC